MGSVNPSPVSLLDGRSSGASSSDAVDIVDARDQAAVGDYVCGLQPSQIAWRAHLSSVEAGHALRVLVDAARLEPLSPRSRNGYRLRLDRGRERLLNVRGRR